MATSASPDFDTIYQTIIGDILGNIEASAWDFTVNDGEGLFARFLNDDSYIMRTDPPPGNKLIKKLRSNNRKKTGAAKEINQEFRVTYLHDAERRAKYGAKAVKKLHEAGVLGQLGDKRATNYAMLLDQARNKPRSYHTDYLHRLLVNYWVYPTFAANGIDHLNGGRPQINAYPTSGYPIFQQFVEEQDDQFAFQARILYMCAEMRHVASKSLQGPKEAVRIFLQDYYRRFGFRSESYAVPGHNNYINLKDNDYELLESYAEQLSGYNWFSEDLLVPTVTRAPTVTPTVQLKSIKIKNDRARDNVEEHVYWC